MTLRTLVLLILLPVIGFSSVYAQEALDPQATLPLTPDVHHGVLANGLTFYIQHHEQPAERAEIQLVLRVGALQETEDQLGLAHFLEHMMFNGTERFPANELIDYFERNGMQFGPDVNAFTGHEITAYLLSVNTADPELYDTAWDVLLDWATNATLDPVEVEKEVGVIVEEWRQRRQNANGRINEQAFPILLGDNARHVTRDILGGDMSVVRSVPTAELRSFYETWYRPELMAVIVVGDVDVDDAEARIREHFAPLTNAPDAPGPQRYDIEAHADTRVGILTDPEYPLIAIQLLRKDESEGIVSVGAYRDYLRDRLFNAMLNERLQERQRQADAPFLQARAFDSGIIGNVALHSLGLSAGSDEEDVLAALGAVLDELERVRRDGFTEGELADAKADLQQAYDTNLEEKDFRSNASIASEYQQHFVSGELSPGIEVELELLQEMLPQLTLATMKAPAERLLQAEDRVLLVTAPERVRDSLPTADELYAELDAQREVAGYEEVAAVDTLLEAVPEAAAIVSERVIEGAEWPLSEWTFANGVRLLLMPTDLAEKEVLLTGLSPGGHSLFSDEAFLGGTFVNRVVQQSGVGALNQDQLERYLSGRHVDAGLYLTSTHEGVRGHANHDELETLFQLVHLYLTQPRLDAGAFEAERARGIVALEHRDLDPFTALGDAINGLLYEGDSPRHRPATIEEMEALDAEAAFADWRARWAETGDLTFALVGSFAPDDVREAAQRYLGTLPGGGATETWLDHGPRYPERILEREVYAGLEEQVVFVLAYLGDFVGDEKEAADLRALGDIIGMRATETLREDLSGTYSPFADATVNPIPLPRFTLQTFFFSNPEKVEELREATFAILEDLRENGPTEAEVDSVRAQRLTDLQEAREENRYWLGALRHVISGARDDYGYTAGEAALWEGLDAGGIQQQAEAVLGREGYLLVTLYPEALAPE